MPIVRADDAPVFPLTGIDVTGLAGPARGCAETTTYRIAIEGGASLPLHHHDHEEIVHIVEGSAVQVLDGQEHRVGAGDTVIIPAGTWHRVFAPAEGTATLLCAIPAGTKMIREDGSEIVPPWGE
jgi:quercetin dioxygenase-like cupin family protein